KSRTVDRLNGDSVGGDQVALQFTKVDEIVRARTAVDDSQAKLPVFFDAYDFGVGKSAIVGEIRVVVHVVGVGLVRRHGHGLFHRFAKPGENFVWRGEAEIAKKKN